jgi:hypothetical protein
MNSPEIEEMLRLQEAREKRVPWRKWGPYLSERQWGTVREDYSDSGDAWNYFSHDQARSRDINFLKRKFQSDPHWRDNILFYEYFHGDNGAGLGASHQTGWTGVAGRLIQVYGLLDQKTALQTGIRAAFEPGTEASSQVNLSCSRFDES